MAVATVEASRDTLPASQDDSPQAGLEANARWIAHLWAERETCMFGAASLRFALGGPHYSYSEALEQRDHFLSACADTETKITSGQAHIIANRLELGVVTYSAPQVINTDTMPIDLFEDGEKLRNSLHQRPLQEKLARLPKQALHLAKIALAQRVNIKTLGNLSELLRTRHDQQLNDLRARIAAIDETLAEAISTHNAIIGKGYDYYQNRRNRDLAFRDECTRRGIGKAAATKMLEALSEDSAWF